MNLAQAIAIAAKHGAPPSCELERELKAACLASRFVHARALNRLGVSSSTIADLRRQHWGWGVVNASAGDDGLYLPGSGEPHLVLPVIENGDLIDLVAFRSATPERWLLRTGQGWALGLERGLEPHTWHPETLLSCNPLDWLRADCEGLCVLDWGAPETHYLVGVPHLECSTPELAGLLRGALSKPVRLPTISIKENRLAA